MALEQNSLKVARQAKNALLQIKGSSQYLEKDYIGFLNGFPSFISQNGLVQAMAFIKAKKADLYKQYEQYFGFPGQGLLEILLNESDLYQYIVRQKKAIDFATWLKQLANALFKKPEDKKEDEKFVQT